MKDYFDLKEKIEALIQQGKLRQFVASCLQFHSKIDEGPLGNKSPKLDVLREIKVITRGPTTGGELNSSRKAHFIKKHRYRREKST